MKIFLFTYLITATIFLLIDLVWLSQSVGYFYEPIIGELLRDDLIITAAVLFYLVYPLGINILVVLPNFKRNMLRTAFLNGFVFGFVAYGTYNLTNMALLKGWSVNIVIVDMLWGGILTVVSSSLAVYGTRKILNLR